MIGTCVAKPIRLVATMTVPGIQSLPASTVIQNAQHNLG